MSIQHRKNCIDRAKAKLKFKKIEKDKIIDGFYSLPVNRHPCGQQQTIFTLVEFMKSLDKDALYKELELMKKYEPFYYNKLKEHFPNL